MSRPSLIVAGEASGIDQVPWIVQDARARSIPAFYPPMNPRCTAMITDASPSIVAARIANALSRRSISVEYDDESVSPFFVIVVKVPSYMYDLTTPCTLFFSSANCYLHDCRSRPFRCALVEREEGATFICT